MHSLDLTSITRMTALTEATEGNPQVHNHFIHGQFLLDYGLCWTTCSAAQTLNNKFNLMVNLLFDRQQ